MNTSGNKSGFLEELRRRNVIRVGVAYLITAWLVAQIADLVLDNIDSPDWVMQTIMLVLALGFPFALIFAWAFELTPEGIKKEKDVDRTQSITPQTGRKLDFAIIGVLAVALGYFIWESRFDKPADEKGSDPISRESAATAEPQKGKLDPTPFPEQGSLPQNGADGKNAGGSVAAVKPSEKSIAVLPFVNMSEDANNEYFSDGISEEILNSLAKVKELKVAGRTSSFAFKGENQDLRQIGSILGVEHILEGSVRKSGTKVRITAQLIQVEDGFHLWSESYDRELDDVFAIQDEIAQAILEQLKLHLLDDGEQLVVTSTRADSQAYDLYLLAKQRMYERTGPTIQSAVELLDRAIVIDPEYAPAYAQRGIAELLLAEGTGTYGDIPLKQALANGKLYLDKALQLDPELAEGWAGIGLYHLNQPVITDTAIAPLKKALELNPNLIDASNWLNNQLLALGRPTEAKQVMEGLVELDPLYRPGVRNLVNSYAWFGEFDKAQAYLDRVRPLIPNDANIQSSQAAIYLQQGHSAKALQAVEQAIALQPSNSVAHFTRGLILMDTQQWERLLDEGVEWQPMYALTVLGRAEEATLQAYERAEKLADVPSLFNFLNLTNRSTEVVAYLEERWADLNAFEKDFPPYGGLGYLPMLDVALAYARTGNAERFDDAMQRVQRVNSDLIKQGINHPVFFMGEAAHQALAGNIESSLEFLDRAVVRGATSRLPMVLDWPQFEPLQGDPRFEEIQARMIEHVNAERAELGLEPVSI